MPQKKYKNVAIWAAAPNVVRARPVHLSTDSTGRLAYASNKSVYIRDIAHPFENTRQFNGHRGHKTTVAKFSPNGNYIASGDVTGKVMVWDTHGEDMIVKFNERVLTNEVNDIAWDARNEKFMVVGTGSNLYGKAFTIDGSSAGEAYPKPPIDANGKVTGHTGLTGTVVINAVAISPNPITSSLPSRAVTVGDDHQMGFYRGPRYKWVTSCKQHTAFVYDAAFSPDGKTIVTVGADKKINLFDGEDGSFKESFDDPTHTGSIFSVDWDATGCHIVTASADRTVKLWDVATKSIVQKWKFGDDNDASTKVSEQQVGVLFTKSSAAPIISLSNSGALNYLDPSTADRIRVVQGHKGSIGTMCVVEQSKTIFTGSYDGRVCAWDIAEGNANVVIEEEAKIGHLTPTEDFILYSLQKKEDEIKKITLDDLSTNNILFTDYEPRGVAVQGDLTFVATIKDIKIMEGENVIIQEDTEFTPTALAANPRVPGEFAVGGADYSVHIYSYVDETLSHKHALKFRDEVTCLAYSAKGDILAAGFASSHIVLYSADKNYQVLSDKFTFHNGRIKSLAFNPSGTHFLSGSLDSHVYVWAVPGRGAHGKIKIDEASGDGVYGVGWVGDKRIVTAGHDAAVKIWDVEI